MKFKGLNFRETTTVLVLPMDWNVLYNKPVKNIYFGKVVPFGKRPTKSSVVIPSARWGNTDIPVYATPITSVGHRTDSMMYTNTHAYLRKGGRIYSAVLPKKVNLVVGESE